MSIKFTGLPFIKEIDDQCNDNEFFILRNGHAGLALYVVLEKYYGVDPVDMLHKHGIHPGRDLENHLYCSTGSLGSGLPIAIGHALATPEKRVWCMISDGEAAEGSIWESLRYITDNKVNNIEVYANINGMGAYDPVDSTTLINRLRAFMPRIRIRQSELPNWSFAKDLLTHYYVLKEQDYKELINEA